MTRTLLGKLDWGHSKAKDLHRDYWVKLLVETTSDTDGPQLITSTAGLPTIGSAWTWGDDNDPWALCYPSLECETVIKNEKNFWWVLKYNYSTRPWIACAEVSITSPLSQPDVITGSFVNSQERTCSRRERQGLTGTGTASGTSTGSGTGSGGIYHGWWSDDNGKLILSSSMEPIWQTKEIANPTIIITQTVLDLELELFAPMILALNDTTIWGMPRRCIQLRNVPWRRLVWGLCTYYFQRTLEFAVNAKTFDLTEIPDVGTMVLNKNLPGYIARASDTTAVTDTIDRNNPNNFVRATDASGNILNVVYLDGHGEMCTDPYNHKHFIPKVELYDETNFLSLGVPATLKS